MAKEENSTEKVEEVKGTDKPTEKVETTKQEKPAEKVEKKPVEKVEEKKPETKKQEKPTEKPKVEKPKGKKVVKDKKPEKRKLKITKIIRNMKGGAILSFAGSEPDIVVDTQKYRKGDTYHAPTKSKTTKKK